MDWILEQADAFLLDNLYAKALPLSSYNATPSLPTWFPLPANLNTSSAEALAFGPTTVSAWPRDYLPRQIVSLTVITVIGIHVLYFLFASLSYYFIFNHDMMNHPRFLKNQVALEIKSSLASFPGMTALTLPTFLGEVRGYTKLYNDVADYGWPYLIFSCFFYLVFTDYLIYLIHRGLHHPLVYKYIHKPHHKWLIPTPFASHAFHPVDGYLQSVPYHLFIYLFPMQRHVHLVMFVLVNIWSILIHDSDMITGHALENFINGPAHHTLHHLYFTCNYGQYFTWADKHGGSYKHPDKSFDPLNDVPKSGQKQKTD